MSEKIENELNEMREICHALVIAVWPFVAMWDEDPKLYEVCSNMAEVKEKHQRALLKLLSLEQKGEVIDGSSCGSNGSCHEIKCLHQTLSCK